MGIVGQMSTLRCCIAGLHPCADFSCLAFMRRMAVNAHFGWSVVAGIIPAYLPISKAGT